MAPLGDDDDNGAFWLKFTELSLLLAAAAASFLLPFAPPATFFAASPIALFSFCSSGFFGSPGWPVANRRNRWCA